MTRPRLFDHHAAVAVLFALALGAPALAQKAPLCPIDANGRVANVFYERNAVFWQPIVEHERLQLTVGTPCSTIVKVFERGETPSFDLGEVAGDIEGAYGWELRVVPAVDPGVRKALDTARAQGDMSTPLELQAKGLLPTGPLVESGRFSVVAGAILDPASGKEESSGAKSVAAASPLSPSRANGSLALASDGPGAATAPLTRAAAAATVLTNADGVVRNSLCVGFDCPNSPSFSDTTILMMENNTRIKFDDTSTAASFPRNDWEIEANSNLNGGASYLGFNDCGQSSQGGCATDLVFAVEAGVRQSALYVESDGDVGIGTSNPVVTLHLIDSDTPTVRLEQDGSAGFQPQTWDVAGNETNFFVRDATNGSALPFRIRPGAPSNSIFVDVDGDVGIGTSSPDAALDVDGGSSDTELRVTGNSAGTIFRTTTTANNAFFGTETSDVMAFITGAVERMRISTTGRVAIGCANPTTDFAVQSTSDAITDCATAPFSHLTAGNSTFTASSSRTIKENIQPVRSDGILDRIAAVDVYTYDFINGPPNMLGLMAEDFHTVFGRGSDKMITGQDVQMALWLAVQELAASNQELRREIDELRKKGD